MGIWFIRAGASEYNKDANKTKSDGSVDKDTGGKFLHSSSVSKKASNVSG